jgi:hypothetical protein
MQTKSEVNFKKETKVEITHLNESQLVTGMVPQFRLNFFSVRNATVFAHIFTVSSENENEPCTHAVCAGSA